MARIEISVMPPLAAPSSIGATSSQNIMRFAQMADEYGFNAILLQDYIGIRKLKPTIASSLSA